MPERDCRPSPCAGAEPPTDPNGSSVHPALDPRAWLAAIVDSAEDAIVSKRLDGTITSWNPGAQRMFGYEPSEVIGGSIMRLVPPDLHDEELEILRRLRRGERIEHYETTRMRKDGRRIRVSLTISPVRDGSGRILGASKIARDVTAQRTAERAAGYLAAIVASSDDAIISKDLTGIITSWNEAAERLYGYTAEEMIGVSVLRIIPPELHEDEARILATVRRGVRIEHYETVRLAKGGRRVDVALTVSPVRDASGQIIGASKIARDISGQREAQRRKDEFLAVLAHELRNPLAPVRNAIALFRVPGLTEEQRGRAQRIAERQVEHMARLLDDLLDVSRINTGRVELKRTRVELRPLVNTALEATRALAESRHHHLNVTQAEEPVWLDADPVRITQILTNLLTNAVKYTDEGGTIELVTRLVGPEVLIQVRDSGIGFTPEMRERLFTLFSQDATALTRATGGLGIGLALVREFVERHGGRVEATSAGPGHGSEFSVRLPRVLPPSAR